jgi:hypothetical protein
MQKLLNRQVFLQEDKGLTVVKGVADVNIPFFETYISPETVLGFAQCNFVLGEEYDPKVGGSLATLRALQAANTMELVAARKAEAKLKRFIKENKQRKAQLKAKEARIIDSLDKTANDTAETLGKNINRLMQRIIAV